MSNGVSITVASGTTDPSSAYQRGVYFDGIDDLLKVSGLILHYEFTLEAWVKYVEG
jgi:hypothetical protein